MKILFHIAHPAQYHMLKHVIQNLKSAQHFVKITINTKDILESLLKEDNVEYENIMLKRRKKNNFFSSLWSLIKKDLKLFRIQRKYKFDLLVGTETALAHIGWLFRKPSIIMVEDDVAVIKNAAKLSFPFAKHIVAPHVCNLGKWTKKKIPYHGYQKLAYLHPNYFTPNSQLLNIDTKESFFLIRISKLSAYHDLGKTGFSNELLERIIAILEPHGQIVISSEKTIPEKFSKYIFRDKLIHMHHYLSFAQILITDSQSMCVEAAMLGTPSLRISSFAGKISVLEELEHKYELTYGFKPQNEHEFIAKLENLLHENNLKNIWKLKKEKMLDDKIDCSAFFLWFIENYPESKKIITNNPDFQFNFR